MCTEYFAIPSNSTLQRLQKSIFSSTTSHQAIFRTTQTELGISRTTKRYSASTRLLMHPTSCSSRMGRARGYPLYSSSIISSTRCEYYVFSLNEIMLTVPNLIARERHHQIRPQSNPHHGRHPRIHPCSILSPRSSRPGKRPLRMRE